MRLKMGKLSTYNHHEHLESVDLVGSDYKEIFNAFRLKIIMF